MNIPRGCDSVAMLSRSTFVRHSFVFKEWHFHSHCLKLAYICYLPHSYVNQSTSPNVTCHLYILCFWHQIWPNTFNLSSDQTCCLHSFEIHGFPVFLQIEKYPRDLVTEFIAVKSRYLSGIGYKDISSTRQRDTNLRMLVCSTGCQYFLQATGPSPTYIQQ